MYFAKIRLCYQHMLSSYRFDAARLIRNFLRRAKLILSFLKKDMFIKNCFAIFCSDEWIHFQNQNSLPIDDRSCIFWSGLKYLKIAGASGVLHLDRTMWLLVPNEHQLRWEHASRVGCALTRWHFLPFFKTSSQNFWVTSCALSPT